MSDKKQIIIFGDSIAYGSNDFEHQGWAGHLRRKIDRLNSPSSKWRLYNPSVGGFTSQDMIDHVSPIFEPMVSKPANLDYDTILVIAYGANDTKSKTEHGETFVPIDRYIDNIESMIIKANEHSNTKTILANITPVNEEVVNNAKSNWFYNSVIDQYNIELSSLATKYDLDILDFNSAIVSDIESNMSFDGVHLSEQGYKRLFDYIDSYLTNISYY